MPIFSSRAIFKNYDKHKKERSDPKVKLSEVFRSYADSNGDLNKEKLKDAFLHLDAAMPYRQAEEALRVVGKSYYINTKDETDLNTLVDYAYNKGYGYSI